MPSPIDKLSIFETQDQLCFARSYTGKHKCSRRTTARLRPQFKDLLSAARNGDIRMLRAALDQLRCGVHRKSALVDDMGEAWVLEQMGMTKAAGQGSKPSKRLWCHICRAKVASRGDALKVHMKKVHGGTVERASVGVEIQGDHSDSSLGLGAEYPSAAVPLPASGAIPTASAPPYAVGIGSSTSMSGDYEISRSLDPTSAPAHGKFGFQPDLTLGLITPPSSTHSTFDFGSQHSHSPPGDHDVSSPTSSNHFAMQTCSSLPEDDEDVTMSNNTPTTAAKGNGNSHSHDVSSPSSSSHFAMQSCSSLPEVDEDATLLINTPITAAQGKGNFDSQPSSTQRGDTVASDSPNRTLALTEGSNQFGNLPMPGGGDANAPAHTSFGAVSDSPLPGVMILPDGSKLLDPRIMAPAQPPLYTFSSSGNLDGPSQDVSAWAVGRDDADDHREHTRFGCWCGHPDDVAVEPVDQ